MAVSPYQNHSVLIVDDQEFVLKIVTTILTKIGFGDIKTATDGATAMAAIEESVPDLMICDIGMKPVNGLELLKSIRQNESGKIRKIPLIFLTGEFSHDLVEKATSLGCDMFLLKPISPAKLQAKIDDLFDTSVKAPEDVRQAED
ncbi:MAG: response regulator [Rhodospirillales bacterium]|nr:response regulator [Rhodospirillales bacterium]